MSALRRRPARSLGGPRIGTLRVVWWTLAVVLAVLPLALAAGRSNAAAARTSVAPVLSCPVGMALDSASGTCLTVRTETVARSMGCPAGWNGIAGPGSSLLCQRRTERRVDTGRTRRVYSHTTTSDVWIRTGSEQVQTGTRRVWVPPRTVVYPLVPPVRAQVGTRTVRTRVTMPGPPVSYEVETTRSRRVKRCAFDPYAGATCWHERVTETRTRSVCCRPGPDIVQTVTREVPVYEWQTTSTYTEPGRWDTEPVYSERETGYWHTVESMHYTTEPIYETKVELQTQLASLAPCAAGWRLAGGQCSRTVLGAPSAAPTQQCPSGSVPRYGDALGGNGPSVLSCQSSVPGSKPDTGTEQENSGGPDDSPDGGARPLHHLAGESDERLAELGIHRCASGLLSYVPCDELPGRSWDSDSDICDGIEGTTYRPDHGGSCVTASDLLNKCTKPGDCEETTIRTYCPAIGELSDTQIQEHAHPHRGAETYRVCIFDCSSFGTLPPYVQTRINGSYDYACLPASVPDEEPSPTTTTTTIVTTTTTAPGDDDDGGGDSPVGGPDDPPDTTTATTQPTTTTAAPGPQCPALPPLPLSAADAAALAWESRVRPASAARSPQADMPGEGRFLQVAPGRGWMRAHRTVQISDASCTWTATHVRTAWSQLRPWVAAERRLIEAEPGARHVVDRWDALNADQQQLLRQWHRPGATPAEVTCAIADAAGAMASSRCGWLLGHPATYAWRFEVCFEATPVPRQRRTGWHGSTPNGRCWVTLGSGVDWIRPVSDYADGRVTLTQSGVRP